MSGCSFEAAVSEVHVNIMNPARIWHPLVCKIQSHDKTSQPDHEMVLLHSTLYVSSVSQCSVTVAIIYSYIEYAL